MLISRFAVGILLLSMLFLGTSAVLGQHYPNKPIRIVTAEPGGGADFFTRLIAQGLTGSLGQPVIVENRPNGPIPFEIAARAPPDGYTLLFYSNGMWILPLLQKASYDPLRDFSPITLAATAPNILVVHPSVTAKSVKELIALAKARPGELNYGSAGLGGSLHLAAELFKVMAGVNIVLINYKGGGPATNAVLAGEVQLSFPSAGSVAPHLKSGKLRALAVTSAEPSALAPDLPTVAATVPGYQSVQTYGIFAPAKTSSTTIARLNQEIVRLLNRPDIKEKFLTSAVEPVTSSPEQFVATIKSDMARMGKVIKAAGIKAD